VRDNQNPRERSPLMVWLIAGAVLSPFVYVLSTGLAVWLIYQGCLPDEALNVYLPLWFLAENCKPISEAFDWYVGLWDG
jgi:hypothetical protein